MVTVANIENPYIWVAIIALVLIMFGGQKIPELMRSLGRGKREFERGLREGDVADDELRKEKEREAEIRRRVEEEMRREQEKNK